jgi:hypothetical protein
MSQIPIAANTIEVIKALTPAADPGLFNLEIDGTIEFADAADGDTTGPVSADPNVHTVSESAGTTTSLSAYDTDITCQETVGRCTGDNTIACLADPICEDNTAGTCDLTPTTVASCTGCTSLNVTVPNQQSAIVCTLSNTNKCDNVVCQPANPPCEGGEVCNPSTGTCEAQADAPLSTPCEADGDLCTNDQCDGNGSCVFQSNVSCQAASPPCEAGETCNSGTGLCDPVPDAPLGTSCDLDADLCTIDECDGTGSCVQQSVVSCGPPPPPCVGGQLCNPGTGLCEALPDPVAGTPCDADADLCTIDECNGSGSCAFQSNVVCPDAQCALGVCDPGTGACDLEPITPCCGNDVAEGGEVCDGADDAVCFPDVCALPGGPDECTCVVGFCGDGVLNPAAGEECDPPQPLPTEICDNQLDDDADGLIDCEDSDCPAFCKRDRDDEEVDLGEPCASHRDCRIRFGRRSECVSLGTCGSECVFVNRCARIDKDPALIIFASSPDQLDKLVVHGRFVVEQEADLIREPFTVTLSNGSGMIYQASLVPGDLVARGKGVAFKDKTAKLTGGIRHGLKHVKLKFKLSRGRLYLIFSFKAYADLSLATEPRMAISVTVGNLGGFNETEWKRTAKGWQLSF